MNVSSTLVLENMVKAKVESGYYNNASEVIRGALRLMDTNELLLRQAKLKLLQEHLLEGMEEVHQRKGFALSTAETYPDFLLALSKRRECSA